MVDVIIPVFNTPIEALERCISSVLRQSYPAWQAILVDDGSKPELANWLDEKYGGNPAIEIVHTENCGVSSARNTGLSHSTGDYIVFCDADDELAVDFLQDAVSLIEKYQLNMAAGGCMEIRGTQMEDCCCNTPEGELWMYQQEQIHNIIDYMLTELHKGCNAELGKTFMGSVWGKVYRRSALEGICFDTAVPMCEDLLFNLECLLRCDKIGVTPSIWYTYHRNDFSARGKPREKISLQQVAFSNAVNRHRDRCKKAQLENALNICIFWKMEYCLRTAYLKEGNTCIPSMRRILALDAFFETNHLDIRQYQGIRMRKKLLLWIADSPLSMKPWLFRLYYRLFYFGSNLLQLLRQGNTGVHNQQR